MINKLHHRIQHHAHLPILGLFSAVAGTFLVVGVLVAEFSVPKNIKHVSSALTSTTASVIPCKPPIGQAYDATHVYTAVTSNGAAYDIPVFQTNNPTFSGTQILYATYAPLTGISSGTLELSTACVEIFIWQNGTPAGTNSEQDFYIPFSSVRSGPSIDGVFTLAIPFATSLLSNSTTTGYTYGVRIYKQTNLTEPWKYTYDFLENKVSGTFYVQNGIIAADTPYQITQPTSAFTTSSTFGLNAWSPLTSVSPSIVRARTSPTSAAVPMLPWSSLGGSNNQNPNNGHEFYFTIPPADPGIYILRACPYGLTSAQLQTLNPAANCSTPLTVTYSASSVAGATPSYQITQPTASAITTSTYFTIKVQKTTSAARPYLYIARSSPADSTLPVLPWSQQPASDSITPENPNEFNFIVPMITSGQYLMRACDTQTNLTQLIPSLHCSDPLLVTFASVTPGGTSITNTSTTNTSGVSPSTTDVPASPIINTPAAGALLNELSVVSGNAEPGIKVKMDVFRQNTIVLTTLVQTAEQNAAATNGAFNFGISALPPGNYRIEMKTLKNGVLSPVTNRTFTITPVTLKFTSRSPSPLSGIVIYDVEANRTDISVMNFTRYTTSVSSQEYQLGRLTSPVQGATPTKWSFSFNSKEVPNGRYNFRAIAEVAGIKVGSDTLTLEIQNTTTVPVPLPAVNTNTATTNTNTVSTNTNVGQPTIPVPQPPVSTNLSTNADATTVITTSTKESLDNHPDADPRISGTKQPEKLVVQAVTTIESATNIPSGLKLNGVGPANRYVTVYIFSDPVIITTLTDGNGNWTYTLDRPLENGSHEIYVTLTDDTGAVQEKSNPLAFFVAEARAVSPADFQRFQSQQAKLNDTYTGYYVVMAGLLIIMTIMLFLYLRLRRHHQKYIANS